MSYGGWGAGYVAYAPANDRFTAVTAVIRLPVGGPVAPKTGGGDAWLALWAGIGIDASGSDELMQAGVMLRADPSPTGTGYVWNLAVPWWINEPVAPTEPNPMRLVVAPGDTVRVDVRQVVADENAWTFTVTDVTTGGSVSASCTACQATGRTAAWVVEDPTSGGAETSYADPGSVQFLNATAALNGGPMTAVPALAWHPLLRQAGGGTEGPLGPASASTGAFTVGPT